MKMLKYLLILSIINFLADDALAQYDYPGALTEEEKEKNTRKSGHTPNLFLSPRLGFSVWNDYAYVEVAPIVGYKLTKRFWLGAGPEYLYVKSGNYKSHVYGLNSFAYFAVLDNIQEVANLGISSIFLYVENELLSIKPFDETRGWYDLVLGGIGIRIPIGDRMGISIIALWGLNPATELLYSNSNPEIRIMYDF